MTDAAAATEATTMAEGPRPGPRRPDIRRPDLGYRDHGRHDGRPRRHLGPA